MTNPWTALAARSLLAAAAILHLSLGAPRSASAQTRSNATVSAIEVEGNLRVETEAILQQLETQVGDPVSDRRLGEDIRGIFDLGYFEDIRVDARREDDGIVLTYIVVEKPSIASVHFVGNEEADITELREVSQVRRGAILDPSSISATERNIEELYREKGHYLSEVDSAIEPAEEGTVKVTFMIREYDQVRVAQVLFTGNEQIADEELTNVMQTRPGGYFSFLTKFGLFQRESFSTDLERIRLYYWENGYLDVAVGDPVLDLSRDRRRLYITIPITEGNQYSVSDVGLSGELLQPPAEMMSLVELEAGSTFRASTVRGDIERLTAHYKNLGYAFANVNMLTRMDPEARQVGVTYDVQRGELVYIGRIEFVGNRSTRDKVIRREMVIQEGDLYSGEAIDRSRRLIRRLGFFEEITIREQAGEVEGTLDLEVEVKERSTGSFQIGAGFSSFESAMFTAQISHSNLFGRGQSISLQATFSAIQRLFSLTFTEPYLFDTRWQLTLNIFDHDILFQQFSRSSRGLDFQFGYPLTRDRTWLVTAGYRIEDVNVRPGGRSGNRQRRIRRFFQGGRTSSVSTGLRWDTRNDRLFPSGGFFHSVDFELADDTIGSESEFFRTTLMSRFYWEPLWDGAVLKFNATARHITSLDPEEPVKIFERFFAGGPNSVRGFERLSLGPVEPVPVNIEDPTARDTEFVIGGTKMLAFNLELEFPIFKPMQVSGVFFADAGNAFGENDPFTLKPDIFDDANDGHGDSLRTSLGFGFRWRSPLGPLRFEWGYPLSRLDDERRVVFEFSIGNSF